jgi:hypothetical protein
VLRRLKALRKPLAIACIVVLAVGLCGLGLWHLWDAAALRELDRVRGQLRDEGIAVAFGDLRGAPPPDDENAAQLYLAAFKQLEEEEARLLKEFDLSLSLLEPWHVEEALAGELAGNDTLAESLRKATSRPRCEFRIEYRGMATPLPHIHSLRQAMNWMIARTAERARSGDLAAAFDGLRIAANMPRSLEGEPLIVSQVVRMACDKQVLDALEVLLPLADDPVARLQIVAPDDCRGAAWKGLRGEIVALLDTAGEKAKELGDFFERDRSLSFRFSIPAYRTGLAGTARLLADVLDAENLSYREQLRARGEALGQANANPVMRFLIPVLLDSIVQEGTHASRVVMARLAAELLAFRRRTGNFPETLEALGLDGAVTRDPFTERPFRLLRRDEGTWIASEAAPLDDEEDIRWVLEDEEGEFAWARWRVDAPLPTRSRPEERGGVQTLKGIAESLGIRVSRRGLTEDQWFEKVKAEVEAAGIGIQFGPADGKAARGGKEGRDDDRDPPAED